MSPYCPLCPLIVPKMSQITPFPPHLTAPQRQGRQSRRGEPLSNHKTTFWTQITAITPQILPLPGLSNGVAAASPPSLWSLLFWGPFPTFGGFPRGLLVRRGERQRGGGRCFPVGGWGMGREAKISWPEPGHGSAEGKGKRHGQGRADSSLCSVIFSPSPRLPWARQPLWMAAPLGISHPSLYPHSAGPAGAQRGFFGGFLGAGASGGVRGGDAVSHKGRKAGDEGGFGPSPNPWPSELWGQHFPSCPFPWDHLITTLRHGHSILGCPRGRDNTTTTLISHPSHPPHEPGALPTDPKPPTRCRGGGALTRTSKLSL